MDDSRPASQQVADVLRAEIASGALEPGDKLQSIRNLAQRFRVAPMTAQAAVEILRNEGLVYTSPGRGTFVRRRVWEQMSEPSPEFQEVTEHLNQLDAQMREMADRVGKLEELMRHEGQAQR
jgi:GntR family transcriptional regulator